MIFEWVCSNTAFVGLGNFGFAFGLVNTMRKGPE